MDQKECLSRLPKFLKNRKPVKKPKEGVYYWKVASATDYRPLLIKMGSIDIDRESPGCFGFSYPNDFEIDVADKHILIGLQYTMALANLNRVLLFSATDKEVARMKAKYFRKGLVYVDSQLEKSSNI